MITWTGAAAAPLTRAQRLRRTITGAALIAAAVIGYCIPFGWWLP